MDFRGEFMDIIRILFFDFRGVGVYYEVKVMRKKVLVILDVI